MGTDIMQVGIIGCGNMGQAFVERLSTTKDRWSLLVSDADPARRKAIQEKYFVKTTDDNARLAAESGVVILALKPAHIDAVVHQISRSCRPTTLIITIAAGVSTERITKGFSARVPVIRAMPNMPALVGEGITALCAGPHATALHVKTAKDILSLVGGVIELDERLMDAVTAISGSGPAYFFYLAECMMESARTMGLTDDEARALVVKTAFGSAKILAQTNLEPADLRAKVTSKGGTTEAAFKVFESAGFKEIVRKAIRAARERAKELNYSAPTEKRGGRRG